MSFRERMRVDPSNAEIQVTSELQRQGFYELERDWVLVLQENKVVPMRKEQVKIEGLEGCMFTLPDWFSKAQMKAVYLDGPHHLKGKTVMRDARLRSGLRKHGCKVFEIPYNGRRLSGVRLGEVVDKIKEFLQK